MTNKDRALLIAVLIVLGAGWGFTQPMAKIAVSTGFKHFGLVVWQTLIGSTIMAAICVLRGTRLPLGRAHLGLYLRLALIGTVLPNSASYQAAVHLPSGVLSLLLSMIPMFAFPLALLMGLERFSRRRLVGLSLGLLGVLIIAVPGASFDGSISAFWIGIALIAGGCYAIEGNIVAKWGTLGLDPFQVLLGASTMAAMISIPLALVSGQMITPSALVSLPGLAHAVSSVTHVLVYAGYVWLVARAGPVFAVQVSYLVTGFGIFWASLILQETLSLALWLALCCMFAGMYFVQPRTRAKLALGETIGET